MTKVVKPINQIIQSKPHTPVYRMHRYYARRPYSVFAKLIEHYSDELDVVLDPFSGGGVTLVEGAIQKRRVVGFDINPLAAFITRMELENVDYELLEHEQKNLFGLYSSTANRLFTTICRECGAHANARWFEYTAKANCKHCQKEFQIAEAKKISVGTWNCPHCEKANRFSVESQTTYEIINVAYDCENCKTSMITKAIKADNQLAQKITLELKKAEKDGLWIPDAEIPDCNMQRESALFKKGIHKFRQLFTDRHLLALALLRKTILEMQSPFQDWLLFAFSSSLRYTNRMVTSNPGWRGERPLEWAKPGFWLPPVILEANVLEEFSRRCNAILRGKKDYLSRFQNHNPVFEKNPKRLAKLDKPVFHISTQSSTKMPLINKSVDVIITDPPYGSYVHYADLSNFWSVWLPEIEGLGKVIDDTEEAVIARKKFPKAKSPDDYQRLLEDCFSECARVLKPDGYMVMTFHNREPRAWAALLIAATRAGFELPQNGIIYQSGVPSYKHTAQSRRAGSVIGDFILSFKKPKSINRTNHTSGLNKQDRVSEKELVKTAKKILQTYGELTPEVLLSHLYIKYQPKLLKIVKIAVSQGDEAVSKLINDFDLIQLFDSHRRHLLEEHFLYKNGMWSLKEKQ